MDSTLLAASSLVSHNVVVPLRPGLSERGKVRVARGGVMLFGVTACLLALQAESIFDLVVTASAFGSAGIFVVVVFGLFTRVGGVSSAYAALIAGVSFWMAGEYVMGWSHSFLISLAAAWLAYLGTAGTEMFWSKGRRTVEAGAQPTHQTSV